MADWIMAVGEALAPVMEQLYIELHAGPFLLVDETTVQVLGEENRSDTSLSYMWCAYGGDPDRPAVVYRYAPSRSTKEAHAIVDSYSGIMQTDGYEAYDRLARDRDDLIHAACWADADIARRIGERMHGASLLMPKVPARKPVRPSTP